MRAIETSRRSAGQVCCWLSHLKVLNDISKSSNEEKEKFQLILVDDFVADGMAIDSIPINKYSNMISKEAEWDIIYVDDCHDRGQCTSFLKETANVYYTESRIFCKLISIRREDSIMIF